MTAIGTHLRLILASTALVLSVTACGSCGEEAKTEGPSATPQAKKPEAKANQKTAKQLRQLERLRKASAARKEKAAKSQEPPAARTPEEQFAIKLDIPSYYPDDAPVYPGSAPSTAEMTANGQAALTFGINDDPDTVTSFVRTFAEDNGWTIVADEELAKGHMLQGAKDERRLIVYVASAIEGVTLMSVAVHK